MADIFVGQTNLRIEIDTDPDDDLDIDLTDATLLIKYKKPRHEKGQFSATINGSDESKMYYDIASATDLDRAGKWIFWSHVTFSDGTIGIGEAVEQQIKSEGEI